MMGKTVYEGNTSSLEFLIKLPDVQKGIYFIKILEGDFVVTKKIIIE